MKHTFLLLTLCCITILAWGQEDVDTTIYTVVEEMPRFPGCERLDTTIAVKDICAQRSLLTFMSRNLYYPEEARANNIEGTVVLTFVVEPDSTISAPEILKDIGGGCADEAMRIVTQMNQVGVRWSPGKKAGKPVRVKFTLPVKFKLEEPLPYILYDRDTIYTDFDTALNFDGGTTALFSYLGENLEYPVSHLDSCDVGVIDIQLLVQPDGQVRILDLTDYNDLGFDFWYESIDVSTSSYGLWIPATYDGRKVPAAYELSLSFTSKAETCKEVVAKYDRAVQLSAEGVELHKNGETEAGMTKLTEAVELFPDNAEFLINRGEAYIDAQEFGKACADLLKARRIALLNRFDSILSLICRG